MVLNKNQNIVVLAALGIIVIMGLFPPWIQGRASSNDLAGIESLTHHEFAASYYFLFNPPQEGTGKSVQSGNWVHDYFRLDYGRLFLQWSVVIVVAGGIIFLLGNPAKND
jgi:hypothetical protein